MSLKIEAKYVGKSTVTQHGAKRAATPAKNDAINDALAKSSMLIYIAFRFLFEGFDTVTRTEIVCFFFKSLLKLGSFFVNFHKTNRICGFFGFFKKTNQLKAPPFSKVKR